MSIKASISKVLFGTELTIGACLEHSTTLGSNKVMMTPVIMEEEETLMEAFRNSVWKTGEGREVKRR